MDIKREEKTMDIKREEKTMDMIIAEKRRINSSLTNIMREELMMRAKHFIQSLPLLPEWGDYLESWAQKMQIKEEKIGEWKLSIAPESDYCVRINAYTSISQYMHGIVSVIQLRILSDLSYTELKDSIPPANIVISMIIDIFAVFDIKLRAHEHLWNYKANNYVYILPQHSISSFQGKVNRGPDYSVDYSLPSYSSLVPSRWIHYNDDGILLNGKLPLRDYVYPLIENLTRAQILASFQVFFYNQPRIHKLAIKFLNEFKQSYWYGYDKNVCFEFFEETGSVKRHIMNIEFYPTNDKDDKVKFTMSCYSRFEKWNRIMPVLSKHVTFWSENEKELHFLFRWMAACMLQNVVFLNSERKLNSCFPKITDDFSNLNSVKGALADLFVPKSVAHYLSALKHIENLLEFTLDRETIKIVQDYFNDMLYTIPHLGDLNESALILREEYVK